MAAGGERDQQLWVEKYSPRLYTELLSDDVRIGVINFALYPRLDHLDFFMLQPIYLPGCEI